MRKARETGRMWARMPRLIGKDRFRRHFADVLSLIDGLRAAPAPAARKRNATLRLWVHLLGCMANRSPATLFRHYRQAVRLEIRLGVLDCLLAGGIGDG
jgi:hypothetical protein